MPEEAGVIAREQAERYLTKIFDGNADPTFVSGRRIGWALLDVADAIRELAAAQRERPVIRRRYR